jgi:hypothetical protein
MTTYLQACGPERSPTPQLCPGSQRRRLKKGRLCAKSAQCQKILPAIRSIFTCYMAESIAGTDNTAVFAARLLRSRKGISPRFKE